MACACDPADVEAEFWNDASSISDGVILHQRVGCLCDHLQSRARRGACLNT